MAGRVRHRFDADDLVVFEIEGAFDVDTLVAEENSAMEDPRFGPRMRTLYDLRAASFDGFGPAGVRKMVAADASREVFPARIALVFSSRVAYGFGRMWELLSRREFEARIFLNDIDAARAWLDEGWSARPG